MPESGYAELPSSLATPALRHWIAALELEQHAGTGEWVRFLPLSDGLEGFTSRLGTWRVDTDGSLVGIAGARGLLLASDSRVGPDFEIKGRMELLSSSNGSFQGGVVFGDLGEGSDRWLSFRIKRNAREGQVAYFSRSFSGALQAPGAKAAVLDSNTFLVRFQSGRLTGILNGETVQSEVTADKDWITADRGMQLGVGAYVDENLVELRFRDVQVRKLLSH